MCEGIARPFCSSVSCKPQELPLPNLCVGQGRGRQGPSLPGWGSPKAAASGSPLVGKSPGRGRNSKGGAAGGGGQVHAVPGEGWRGFLQPACVLFVGCCCASLGGTQAPGCFSPLPWTGGCCRIFWGKPYAIVLSVTGPFHAQPCSTRAS